MQKRVSQVDPFPTFLNILKNSLTIFVKRSILDLLERVLNMNLILFYVLPKIWGFIKSTDHRPTKHRPLTHRPTDPPTTNPPTHRPKIHRPTDKFYCKDLIIKKYLFCGIQTQLGKCKTILWSILLNLCLYNWHKKHTEELRYVYYYVY